MVMFQMFSKGNIPFKNYGTSAFSILESSLDLSCVPFAFQGLLSSLLCSEKDRLTILDAHGTLLRAFPTKYHTINYYFNKV